MFLQKVFNYDCLTGYCYTNACNIHEVLDFFGSGYFAAEPNNNGHMQVLHLLNCGYSWTVWDARFIVSIMIYNLYQTKRDITIKPL